MKNAIVDIKDVNKIYGTNHVVKDLNLQVEEGEFLTLLGSSGCGKTTTLRMIAGFEEPTTGSIKVEGEPIEDKEPYERNVNTVFQSYALFPHYNVFDNVAYGLRLRKMDKDIIRKKVLEILDLVELSGMESRMTNQLSGGQQQRVALARALVVEPSVLLFDEPLSNLDAKLRVSMRTEIRNIQQRVGITAIYVTHDQSEAMALSDQIIVMNKGVVAQIGTPQEIYYHPKDTFVANFIGEANFLSGNLIAKDGDKGVIEIYGRSIQVDNVKEFQVGEKRTLVLRPESATLDVEGQLPCEVILSCFMGSYQNYHVKVGDSVVQITDFNPKHKRIFQVGEHAFVKFDACDSHVL